MPYLIIYACAGAALAVIWLPELLRRPSGRHDARSAPPADWQPRTDPAPRPDLRQWRPRYVPDVRPRGQLIREAYASIERRRSLELAAIAAWAA